MLIRVVPLGNLNDRVLEVLCAQLEIFFNSKCRLLRKIEIPPEAHNRFRKQYNAETIMNFIADVPEVKFIDKDIPTLIITDEDMYYRGMNFCFGLEDPTKSAFIVSTARLRPEFYDEQPNDKKTIERLIKEAIHEIGHSKGLYHCINPKCVMCFSPSVSDIDIKARDFCENCKIRMMTKGIEF
ncbi:MAG: archaemetzincin family Zn-dependent metalloprotease [Nanoarchaeota archaeon]|nr:archaemetzincin family Zn-dependent metalloprotease [Nanoarchaeota archaeon]MBU4072416.1 archaemetzincin family Zn-dependent metalloprotease [Candidatus Thermoplasmatota archaeon]MBU4124669.1 archaemetzincin family Zn-dependent metalloprotease [Nanoarchaeota archaeon]